MNTISFENAFTFQPNSLVNTTQRLLANNPLASDYVVNVLNCANASVAWIGRRQPIACSI
ncbi:MAG: hypothetical protein ABIN24_12035 [Dyadobacter sp.]